MHWTDRVALEVQQRVKENKILQKVVKQKGWIVNDAKTPSGDIHVGSARGWVIHDIIAKSMRKAGLKTKFIIGNDDIDPFDAIPAFLDKLKYEKYLGVPLFKVPSPDKNYKSFADYFFSKSYEKFSDVWIESERYDTSSLYLSGKFNEAIRKILDNSNKIQAIYKKIYGKSIGTEKLPFNPICEKCGKVGTTVASSWDGEKVSYECKKDLVDWAQGCGHKGKVSPFDGNGKMPYKVEWPAKWITLGILVESAGKDHFTKTGSRSISNAISCEVFDFPPPWPSTCDEIGPGYEFFLVGGKKMSTSKGRGITLESMIESVPPQLVRFLMVKSRPETAVDFTPEGNTIPYLFRDFEKFEKIYFGLESAEDKDKMNATRVYELTVEDIPKKKPYRINFEFASLLVQTFPEKERLERTIDLLKKIGHVKSLNKLEKYLLVKTLDYAEIWLQKFAPDKAKIKLLEKIDKSLQLPGEIKNGFEEFGKFVSKTRKDQEIWDEIKKVSAKYNIRQEEFFKYAYKILIGREEGPRLVPFIQSLDKGFVSKRFSLEE